MKSALVRSLLLLLIASTFVFGFSAPKSVTRLVRPSEFAIADTNDPDSLDLPYPINDANHGGVYLNPPSNVREEISYDPVTKMYVIQKYIGNTPLGMPEYLTAQQFQDRSFSQQNTDYWENKVASTSKAASNEEREGESLIPDITIDNEAFGRIFGSNTIEIRPQGTAQISFGGRYQKIDNPIIPIRNRSTFSFDFDQRIQLNVTGKIGERLQLTTNYDTEATFAFENKMKLEFKGQEDDIIKSLEMGNVSLPVNSSLITGAQSLFGIKGQFQFGKTTITTVFSEQRSQSQSLNIQGGATTQEFEIWGDQYEANKHYFLSQYFRDTYENSLSTMPVISSQVQITKIEVWVTNRKSTAEDTRNVVAFMDLGESESRAYRKNNSNLTGEQIYPGTSPSKYPNNKNNALAPDELTSRISGVRDIGMVNAALNAQGYAEAIEYSELANARKLTSNEFKFHPQLGYISLNVALNQDEVLAVAYQYTANGRTYQVGEFSTDGVNPPKTLILKLLKSTILNVKVPTWDLMMKNVYALNAFQVSQEDFRLDVLYRDDEVGTPVAFLPKSNLQDTMLLRVMNLDRVNYNGDPYADGMFDFIDNVTIQAQNGRIFFPVLEPFGSNLSKQLSTQSMRDKYVFQELYDSTRFRAQEQTQKNKYLIKGRYKSASGSVIQLNAFNIPRGSVTVTAGGATLVENQDYTIDYSLGQVRILNESIMNSGVPIRVSFENNTLFNFQTKTFMGMTFDHQFNKDFNIGGSLLHLREKPLTQKVNLGDEPIANTIWGLNTRYQKQVPVLTRIVDAIPFIDTKAPSNVQVQAEFAQLLPGSPSGIKINGEETTYIDDFESSQTEIALGASNAWFLASTPAYQSDLFPEGNLSNDLAYNYNRARLAWYIIDPLFFSQSSQTPDNITSNPNIVSTPYQREVTINEVFPNRTVQNNQARNIAMFDVAYYPTERGPYNFDVEGDPGISAGLNADGTLKDPRSRWGGIMRNLTVSNFEEQNIEFIQFWVMDPYYQNPDAPQNAGGDLYFNLGSISEDVLKDGRQSYENGLSPVGDYTSTDSTVWGRVSKYQPVTETFDNDPNARPFQDLGYDGLNSADEANWKYKTNPSYLERISALFGQGSGAYTSAQGDPSGDDFQYFRGADLDAISADVLRRYKYFNGLENNSSTAQVDGYPATSTNLPDREDANRDQTLSKTESYFQYKISFREQDLQQVGQNYITDIYETQSEILPNNQRVNVRWIQFKVPIFEPDQRINGIQDFRSIRFMRMFMTNWADPVVLRFASFDLVRGEWRRYKYSLNDVQENIPVDIDDETVFIVNAVNLEENGARVPVPYVIPPGIDRQILYGTTNLVQQNEQSLSLRVCNLEDGDARAVFKNLSMDMRMYKRLKMFAHAEGVVGEGVLKDDDLNLFIRLGSDYSDNYYEYEMPLKVTDINQGSFGDYDIWPTSNDIDFPFTDFTNTKLERDRAMTGNSNLNLQTRYSVYSGDRRITVKGSPNLGNVRTIMIGLRNPKKTTTSINDDGMAKCAEVWVNELRLSEFDNRGGWAANARVTANLADFANVSVSGAYSTVGFGALDQGPSERNKYEGMSYDVQTSVELGKFFPEEAKLKIPMFFNYAEDIQNPMFNPLDPDIEFSDALNNLETQAQRDSLKKISQDYTQRRSINFTNVRKERSANAKGKPQIYDIENFSVSYSFSEVARRNINTEFDNRIDQRGTLNYTYQTQADNVQPFKNINSKWLTLVKDFNFYYYPSRFSVRADVLRSYQEVKLRQIDDPYGYQLPTTYNKNFTMDRVYDLTFDLTKSLKFDYNARMKIRFDELPNAKADGDTVLARSLQNWGRPTAYNQTANLTWQIPIDKLPYLDFVNVQVRYTGTYGWTTNSLYSQLADSLNYGYTIENGANMQWQGSLNMQTLYSKFPFIARVMNDNPNAGKRSGPTRRMKDADIAPTKDNNQQSNSTLGKDFARFGVGLLTMVKNVTVTYSENNGTLLPGFNLKPNVLGMDNAMNFAPGLDFVLGNQIDIAGRAAANTPEVDNDQYKGLDAGWLVRNPNQPNQYQKTYSENLNIRATVEPIRDFRVDLTATKTYGMLTSSTFRYSRGGGTEDSIFGIQDAGFYEFNQFATGNYSISWVSLGSSFESSNAPLYTSDVYSKFRDNRMIISERFAFEHALIDPNYTPQAIATTVDSSRYGYDGYSVVSQDVLLNSFLAAYGDGNASTIGLNQFTKNMPMPNWRVNYTGLMRMKWFKNNFANFSLSHSYTNVMTITNFQTNLLREQAVLETGVDFPRNENMDFLPVNQIGQVSMNEQFGPFIGINMRMKNNTSFKVDFNKSRLATLSLVNNQINETKSTEITVGMGYIIKDLQFNFIRMGARKTPVKSNLELKLDVSVRDNQTVIRKILENFNQATAGQNILTIKFTADYKLSRRLSAQVYYDHSMSKFKTSNAFPTTQARGGISLRLSLGN